MTDFKIWTVDMIKKYLLDKGVTTTGYKKELLIILAQCVEGCRLPSDPDHARIDTKAILNKKLVELSCDCGNPFSLEDSLFSTDLSESPDFGLYDIFNYLLYSRTDYDRKKLKAYKSFEDYRLFYDGNVENLEFCKSIANSDMCLFRAAVKPTQRDQTYLKKHTYRLWFLLSKSSGSIALAYCECPGG
jgi:hypothetical protein